MGFSEANKTGWMAATDSTVVFTALDPVTDTSILVAAVEKLQASIEQQKVQGSITPLQAEQYTIQLEWIKNGNVPHLEYILFSQALVNPEPGKSCFVVAAGLQVCCTVS